MKSQDCPVCGMGLTDSGRCANDGFRQFKCPRCGLFSLTSTASALLPRRLQELPSLHLLLSHKLRQMQRHHECPQIDSDTLERICSDQALPRPAEQAQNMLVAG